MNLFDLFIWFGVGAICICIGLVIWRQQKIVLIHSYHYKHVAVNNIKPYTERMGKGLVAIGVGSVVEGLINLVANTYSVGIAFGIGFVLGIGIMLRAQWKYNGGLF